MNARIDDAQMCSGTLRAVHSDVLSTVLPGIVQACASEVHEQVSKVQEFYRRSPTLAELENPKKKNRFFSLTKFGGRAYSIAQISQQEANPMRNLA